MNLYRLRLRPRSAWVTPWQADTLSGLLCWTLARSEGQDVLQREILQPAARGDPPFVLSDAFPAGLLPVPVSVRLHDYPPEQRKNIKRARWLPVDDFRRFQTGTAPPPDNLLPDGTVYQSLLNLRNKLDRASGTTGGAGEGGLFSVLERHFKPEWIKQGHPAELDLYVRVASSFEGRFVGLLHQLAVCGFGADSSVGKGQFDLVSPTLVPEPDLDNALGANGIVALSTFQPAPDDPTDGQWEAFTKYGKLGPDFGVDNVFKRPLVMFRPGATFRTHPPRERVGRCIPMSELLAPEACDHLNARDTAVAHLAFGLAVPAQLS